MIIDIDDEYEIEFGCFPFKDSIAQYYITIYKIKEKNKISSWSQRVVFNDTGSVGWIDDDRKNFPIDKINKTVKKILKKILDLQIIA